jgi:pimeloyl-ACP methyl ester carboxylesterase
MQPSTEFRERQVLVSAEIHVVEAGPEQSEGTLLFLHGWTEDWSEFEQVMSLAAAETRAVAIDLPGIGASRTPLPSGEKSLIASYVSGLIDTLSLENVTLVGHDAGGMVAYACLRRMPGTSHRRKPHSACGTASEPSWRPPELHRDKRRPSLKASGSRSRSGHRRRNALK